MKGIVVGKVCQSSGRLKENKRPYIALCGDIGGNTYSLASNLGIVAQAPGCLLQAINDLLRNISKIYYNSCLLAQNL